jgi:hypothetical protein
VVRRSSYLWAISLLIVVSIILLSGCWQDSEAIKNTKTPTSVSITQPSNLEDVSQKLEAMQSQWQAQNLNNYRFQFQWECFCPAGYHQPVWVTVRQGEITSVEAVDPHFETDLPDKDEYRTINELFDLIRDGVEEDAHEIRVAYNDLKGYPISAYIDYEINIEDEEQGFDILKFETELPANTETSQPATVTPAITILPNSGPPGTTIRLMGGGFSPNIPIDIGVGRVNSEYDVITSTNTDRNGNLDTTIEIPDFVTSQDQWVIVAATEDQTEKTVSTPFDVTP